MEIKRIYGSDLRYDVINGDKVYTVELDPFVCSCFSFKFRNSRSGDFCKHIIEVIGMIEKEREIHKEKDFKGISEVKYQNMMRSLILCNDYQKREVCKWLKNKGVF